jgi:ATP-binding cassette subfamily B protein
MIALKAARHQSSLQRLWTLLRVERRPLMAGVILQALQAISHIPFTAGIGLFIDEILPTRRTDLIVYYALANLVLLPIHGAFTMGAYANGQKLIRATVARLRKLVVDQVQRLSLSFFTSRGAGTLSNQVTLDMNRVEIFLEHVANAFVVNVAVGAATLVYLFVLNPLLAGIALLAVPVQIALVYIPRRRALRLNERVQRSGEGFSERVVELVSGMRVIKSFGNERGVSEQVIRQIELLKNAGLRATIGMRRLLVKVDLISMAVPVIVLCVGGVFYLRGRVSIGQLVSFTGLLGFVQNGFSAFTNAYEQWS